MLRRALIILAIMGLSGLLPGAVMAQDGSQHTVAPGETLFRIALRYGVTVDALASANGITNTARIFVGQVLTIPGQVSTQPTVQQPAPAAAAPVAAAPENGSYTVQAGDTLNKIARRYNLTLAALMGANGIVNADLISVGQVLVIPGAGPAQPAAGANASAAPAAAAADQPLKTHVVARGEGLVKIAQKYGVTWQAVAALNELPDPNLIYVGMVLKIPKVDPNAAAGGTVSNPPAVTDSGKLIFVKLSEQRVYFYENGQLVRSVLVSTGLPGTPTVTGDFRIYLRYKAQTMSGPGYYLPNVPYVMYFHLGYGLHGTYWHSNWGHPMSHGCVNMPTDQAQWLYNWSTIGTPVRVRW
ncbi:MAG: LysM peptidoglycan-binding domain-containing protein [Anaerolineae bacterium]|nr:LysM peptidoglycan-binding domain-containing protein [Anaerolineae bacterium]